MSRSIRSNAIHTRWLAGALALLAVPCVAQTAANREYETLLLLAVDGTLAMEPAPERPPAAIAGSETIVNQELVPGITIQTGLVLHALNSDTGTGRTFSTVSWPPDVVLRRHWHPVTERLWMIDGSIASPNEVVGPGQFWEAPAQVAMGPFTSTGAFFVFLGEGTFATFYLTADEMAPKPGRPATVAPDKIPWQPLSLLAPGSTIRGDFKTLSAGGGADRSVHLLRLGKGAAHAYAAADTDIEGYVLQGKLTYSDPYHGIHVLGPGYYFRIPKGFPSSLLVH